MAKEDVELVHRAHEAVNRRDLEGFLELMDEDVEGEPTVAGIEGGYRGLDGMRRWWQSAFEVFPDFRTEIDEISDCGEVMLVRFHIVGRGAGSEASFEQSLWGIVGSRDGKIARWQNFRSEAEALAAAGSRTRPGQPPPPPGGGSP